MDLYFIHAIFVYSDQYYIVCLADEPLTDIHADSDSLKDTLEKILTSWNK